MDISRSPIRCHLLRSLRNQNRLQRRSSANEYQADAGTGVIPVLQIINGRSGAIGNAGENTDEDIWIFQRSNWIL